MKKSGISLFCFILIINLATAQTKKQIWDSIKSNTAPVVLSPFQSQYDVPYKQPLADYGWEDGLQISPDGLNLYALYSPQDLFSWSSYFSSYLSSPICNLLGNMSFMRPYAKRYGMDMTTNPFGCDSFANIDILYAHRNLITDSFTSWQLSGVARPGAIEGSPATLFSQTDPTKLDLFMFTGNNDIWKIKNTTANPTGINNAIRLPTSINPVTNEFNADNPFLERINASTIILIYEKYTDANVRTFMYTTSADTGNTWNTPQAITTVTNSLGHIEHPCLYKDNSNQWWLYFSIDYSYISRAKQTIAGKWDSWGTPENVIFKGNALSIGEPTVTINGDISFSLAYKKNQTNDSVDVYDLDPWILPHKAVATTVKNSAVDKNQLILNVYPNPFLKETTIEFNLPHPSFVTIEMIDVLGRVQETILSGENKSAGINVIKWNNENIAAGIYVCRITADGVIENKIIVKR